MHQINFSVLRWKLFLNLFFVVCCLVIPSSTQAFGLANSSINQRDISVGQPFRGELMLNVADVPAGSVLVVSVDGNGANFIKFTTTTLPIQKDLPQFKYYFFVEANANAELDKDYAARVIFTIKQPATSSAGNMVNIGLAAKVGFTFTDVVKEDFFANSVTVKSLEADDSITPVDIHFVNHGNIIESVGAVKLEVFNNVDEKVIEETLNGHLVFFPYSTNHIGFSFSQILAQLNRKESYKTIVTLLDDIGNTKFVSDKIGVVFLPPLKVVAKSGVNLNEKAMFPIISTHNSKLRQFFFYGGIAGSALIIVSLIIIKVNKKK